MGGFGSPSGIGETAPVTNPNNPYDVNGDDQVNALDALVVINRLGSTTSGTRTNAAPVYLDVNGDGFATALDALRVINYLTSSSRSAMGISVTDSDNEDNEGAASEFDAVDAIFASDEETLF